MRANSLLLSRKPLHGEPIKASMILKIDGTIYNPGDLITCSFCKNP
jgi:hypothetical protein